MEETLESQAEYPQEAVEEVEEAVEEAVEEEVPLPPYQPNQQLPTEETNLLATRHLYLQGTAPNQKHS